MFLTSTLSRYIQLLLGFLFLLCFDCEAQYEHLLHKTHAQRVIPMIPLYDKAWYTPDSVALFSAIDSIKTMAVKAKDDDLLLETALLKANYFHSSKHTKPRQMLVMLDSLTQLAIEKRSVWLQALTENLKAVYNFYYLKNYEAGFQHHEIVYGLIKDLSPEEFPYKKDCLVQMGSEHFEFKDFRKAIFYFRQSLNAVSSFQRKPHPTTFSSLNTLGLCYQELGVFDSSNFFFDSTLAAAHLYKSIPWIGISSGNKGYNYYLKEQYDSAVPLLNKDVEIALSMQDWGLASGSLMVLANINLRKHNLSLAAKQIEVARKYVYQSGQYKRLQDLYSLLAKWYAAVNKPELSALYLDSTFVVKDSLNRQFSAVLLLKAQQKNERQQLDATIESIQNEKKIRTLERNALITAVILLIVLTVVAYKSYTRRLRRKQLELQLAEAELQLASKQLADFTRHLVQKNEMIEMLQQKMGGTNPELEQQLQKSSLLTDEAWDEFAALFEKVHGGYLNRLKHKIPNITPAEIRFMALAKLNLSNKDMAASLGVGPNAIRNIWYRLRKKMDESAVETVEELVETI
jgi:hypothetical protein